MKNHSKEESDLISRGILITPAKKRSPSEKWPAPPGNVSAEIMERAWCEERDDR